MRFPEFFRVLGHSRGWVGEILWSVLALAFGFALMPVLIFYAGSSILGRYEGASLEGMFRSVYGGLQAGSAASWLVLFGPYGLYLMFKALKAWWRLSARLA